MPYTEANYPGGREYECDGDHLTRNVKYAGPLYVAICADPCCAKIISAQCEHSEGLPPNSISACSWNEAGTILSCNFCGKDVT